MLIWVTVVPMLLEGRFQHVPSGRRAWRGISVTRFNWLVKPFDGGARLALRGPTVPPWLPQGQIDSYIAGLIILAAAPCTAIVFVWSNLTDGERISP